MEFHAPMHLSLTTVFGVLFVGFALRWIYWQLTVGSSRRRLIKETGALPPLHYRHKGILGHLFGYDLIKDNLKYAESGHLLDRQRERNFQNGNTIALKVARFNIIVTIEPENIKTILSTKFNDFSLGDQRKLTMTPVFGHGIFTSDGHAWERSRALIRPNFTRQQVADLNIFEAHIQNLINNIPSDGSTVDIQDLFFKLSMDSSTEFLFGKSTNTLRPALDNKGAVRFTTAFTEATEAMAKQFRTGGLSRWWDGAKMKRDAAVIHKFAEDIIDEAIRDYRDAEKIGEQPGSKQYTFLYELLKVTQDRYTLRSELLNVLLAGRDTTASLLSHTFHVIARRPDIWAKLQAEIDELKGEVPDYETLKSMKYLKWVLNESLRVHPVVPGNSRFAVRDTVLPLGGGPDGKSPMFVAKDTVVGYSVYSMHRRTDFYGNDALEFKPERWAFLRPGWEYLPFNGGPRICIGQNFALTEASYTLVRILQHFKRIEPRDARPWSEFITLTLAVGTGVKIGLYES